MSGGGGSGSDRGGNDMQVSGAEAAYSTEKGISTAADTRIQRESFSPGGEDKPVGSSFSLGAADTGYGVGQVDPKLAQATLGADTSTVGIMQRDSILEKDYSGRSLVKDKYSDAEIEKGYTDEGEKLDQVGAGKYLTKSEQYALGLIEKDPTTGQDIQGRYKVNPNTGELEKANLTFAEHWANAPDALKFSPTLRFLYASGKNIGEYFTNRGFKGYNEAGLRGVDGNAALGYGQGQESLLTTDAERDRQIMSSLAGEAPYLVSGTERPESVASNWYKNLGNVGSNEFFFSKGYADAKAKQQNILGNPSAIRYLAVNESPFYDWLKTNSLDKGIL